MIKPFYIVDKPKSNPKKGKKEFGLWAVTKMSLKCHRRKEGSHKKRVKKFQNGALYLSPKKIQVDSERKDME